MKSSLIRLIPLLLLLCLMAAAYLSGFDQFFSYDSLREHRKFLKELVTAHPFGAPLGFIALYAVSTALSIPGGIFLSIFGGFLFPQPFSTLYVVTGATIGATALFFIANTAVGKWIKEHAEGRLQKMRKGFQEDAWSYLLFLRLVPLFPFWLVNIAPAFFGVRLFTYVWTTFVGIIPGAFVFTQTGAGLGAILESGEELTVSEIFNIEVRIALIALGLFALLPTLIKKFR